MVTRDCYLRGAAGLARKAVWRVRGGALILAAALACCAIPALNLRSELVDTGWAVSSQRPFTVDAQQTDPKQQIFLQHVLQQLDSPLQQIRPHAPASAGTAQGSVRFAVRPDGVDGWRPAASAASPLHGPWRMELQTPQLNIPGNGPSTVGIIPQDDGNADGEEVESDCGDMRAESTDETCGESSERAPENESEGPLSDDDVADESAAAPMDAEEVQSAEDPAAEGAVEPAEQSTDTDSTIQEHSEVGPLTDESSAASASKTSSPPPLTKQLMALRSRVRGVLKGYYRRQLNSRENDPWEVMHGMLAYGVHSRIRQSGPRGTPVTSVGWLCYNKPCKKLTLMYVTPKGELRAKYGVGLQGHLGQLLAMLAQCRVSDEYPIRVGNREFTIRDLIEAEQKTCYPKSELTFKLLAFQYYLDLNETWANDQGVEWDFPRLIREELEQPMRVAACGGTHRLSSLSLTVKVRQRHGEPLDGEYARAAEFVKKYHRYAFSLQNRDGSLSTEWFRGRGDDSDIDRRIKTTGHILEWLCYSLSDEELRQPKTVAAVSYLTNLMSREYNHEWEVGPISHATHALLVYDERVFQPFDNADYSAVYRPKLRSAVPTARRGEDEIVR